MSELVVFAFPDREGARQMREGLVSLQKEKLIELGDAAIVYRKDNGKVKIDQALDLTGAGALGGALWGTLIGLLFFMPFLGAVFGALAGALSGKLTDIGVDDDFIREVGETIQPGHAALFLLIYKMTEDKVLEKLQAYNGKILRTSLSNADEEKLKEIFGAAEE